MLEYLTSDIQAAKDRDPAARSTLEILLCYSGLHAITAHRINHWFWTRRFRLLARVLSQITKFLTGVEIHPGAKIGKGFFIDHATGTVIGETTEIGDNCTLFHGVTLGGTGKESGKRHPTLEDDVTVGAHAQILGSLTIGKGSVIGAASVVLDSVPEYCTVVGAKAFVVRRKGKRVYDFRHDKQPRMTDPAVECLLLRIRRLEQDLASVKSAEAPTRPPPTATLQLPDDDGDGDIAHAKALDQAALIERWANRRNSG